MHARVMCVCERHAEQIKIKIVTIMAVRDPTFQAVDGRQQLIAAARTPWMALYAMTRRCVELRLRKHPQLVARAHRQRTP